MRQEIKSVRSKSLQGLYVRAELDVVGRESHQNTFHPTIGGRRLELGKA